MTVIYPTSTIGRQATPGPGARSNRTAMSARWLAFAALSAAACTAAESEVRPDPDTLFFPTAVAVSPDESLAFVVSANSDLTYDSGTIQVVDLAVVDTTVSAWKQRREVPPGCAADLNQPEILTCAEADFLIDGAGVRIGNFASSIGVQDLGSGGVRLLVPVRGDPSLTWMDWDAGARKLRCSDDQGFALCDDDHRLVRLRGDDDLPGIPGEPYAVFVDSVANFAAVAHLASGAVSLIDSPPDGPPVLADAVSVGISGGLTAVAGRVAGPDSLLYAQSRSDDRVFLLTVARQPERLPFLVAAGFFFQNGIGGAGGSGQDSRGLVFRDGGDRAFMINRSPPSLQEFDTSLDATGVPANRLTANTDICRQATAVTAADTGVGERAYVTCYSDGSLYVVDPRAGGMIDTTALVGRGPIALSAAPARRLLLVANFLDNSLAVVDLDPTSPLLHRVVLRIGGSS